MRFTVEGALDPDDISPGGAVDVESGARLDILTRVSAWKIRWFPTIDSGLHGQSA